MIGKTVQVLSDNITSVAYLNHMGGTVKELTLIAKLIWKLALDNKITLISKHLSGKSNTRADQLSRVKDKHEWMLSRPAFRMLDSVWGPHTVDRFASATTRQLPVYNCRYLDPNGMMVDAMAQRDWHEENNFVNPPFRMLSSVLSLIQEQKAHATVIAPWWPAQPWFRTLLDMAITTPIRIFQSAIIQTNEAVPEPLRNLKWKIFAWRICGNVEHFQNTGMYHRHHD